MYVGSCLCGRETYLELESRCRACVGKVNTLLVITDNVVVGLFNSFYISMNPDVIPQCYANIIQSLREYQIFTVKEAKKHFPDY